MSADYLSADYSCIMVDYVKGSKAVGDSHHRTVVKRLFERLPYIAKRDDDKSASADATKKNAPQRKVGLTAHV